MVDHPDDQLFLPPPKASKVDRPHFNALVKQEGMVQTPKVTEVKLFVFTERSALSDHTATPSQPMEVIIFWGLELDLTKETPAL